MLKFWRFYIVVKMIPFIFTVKKISYQLGDGPSMKEHLQILFHFLSTDIWSSLENLHNIVQFVVNEKAFMFDFFVTFGSIKTHSLLGAEIKQVSNNESQTGGKWHLPWLSADSDFLLEQFRVLSVAWTMEVWWSVDIICLEVLKLHWRDGKPERFVWKKIHYIYKYI